MTKYILHGGETGIPNEHNKAFYQEWVKGFSDDLIPTILLVYFARKSEEWPTLEKQDKERFANYTNHRKVNFVIADSDPSKLRNQIKNSDVIYVRGGSSGDAITTLRPLKDELPDLLNGKIYVGSSAGVMVVTHYSLSDGGYQRHGLGIIPLNAFVHWVKNSEKEFEIFKQNYEDNGYEWLLIPETEFILRSY